MFTKNLLLAKVQEKDTDNGIVKALKEVTVTIPKNVIDADYFVHAVQFHVFNYGSIDSLAKLSNANQKVENLAKEHKEYTLAYERAVKSRNDLAVLCNLLKEEIANFDKELSFEYKDVADVKEVFKADNFARIYAWTLMGISSYNIYKSGNESAKGKLDEVHLHFKNESKIIGLLKDFDLTKTQEQKKQSALQISLFANETFGTNGGQLYKNISYKFTAEKINKDLYTRFKNLLKHDGKGNIKDTENSAFTMCCQLYYMCLIQLGVPTINGQKVIKVEEVSTCSNDLKVERKEKEDK